jgi:hypothetical protein
MWRLGSHSMHKVWLLRVLSMALETDIFRRLNVGVRTFGAKA